MTAFELVAYLGFAVVTVALALIDLSTLRLPNVIVLPSTVVFAALLAAGGCGSGVFSGLFTVGGGLVATPMLVRGFGQRQAAAQGLALALVVPGSLIALTTYARADQVNWSLGAPLALGGLSTISWGVACARRLPERVLRAVFVGFLLVTAGLMWPLS